MNRRIGVSAPPQVLEVSMRDAQKPCRALLAHALVRRHRELSMGRSTFWREVAKNNLPQPVRIGGMTRWRVTDLVRFVEGIGRKDERPA